MQDYANEAPGYAAGFVVAVVILISRGIPLESVYSLEVHPVFGEVGAAFGFVPFVWHGGIV